MYLRSTFKKSPNKLNISRGRGRRIDSSPNISITDFPISSSCKPPVLHSPPRSSSSSLNPFPVNNSENAQPVLSPTPFFSHSASNINVASHNLPSEASSKAALADSLEQDPDHLLNISLGQTTTLLGFETDSRTIMATSDNEILPQPGISGTNTENLLAVLRDIRETQSLFATEIGSLRSTVSSLTQPAESLSNRQTPTVNPNRDSSHPPQNSNLTQAPGFRRDKIDLEKWKIHFNGTGSVTEFLFKLDTLVDRTGCTIEQLEANFQIFLSGKAEQWYWQFIKRNNDPPYGLIKRGILKEFSTFESDDDLLMQINSRKQNHKETYEDFHSAILSLNSKMTESISENRLVKILKKNVNSDLRLMLFNSDTDDLHTLRDVARNAEKMLRENKSTQPTKIVNRSVHELDVASASEEDLDFENDPQIDALQFSQRSFKPDYSRIKCWNCLVMGHSHIYCPEETRALFCYKCGERNVSTIKCPKSHLGNRKRSEKATGDSRSQIQTPSL